MATKTSAGETMMMEEPSSTVAATETKQRPRTLDEEDELNQSVNFLTNASATTDQAIAYSSILSRRSSSFGMNETQQQQQQQHSSLNRIHTTGETKLSKIMMRVVFGSCMFTIFTTLVCTMEMV